MKVANFLCSCVITLILQAGVHADRSWTEGSEGANSLRICYVDYCKIRLNDIVI